METTHNAASSRSHCLFTITVESQSAGETAVKQAKLVLVDLAGSESLKKVHAKDASQEEQRQKQAIGINKVLTNLGTVVSKLNSGEPATYRDSALTKLLKDCLGGNSRAMMIANVSPEDSQRDETLKTLDFAVKMMKVENTAKVNRVDSAEQSSLLSAFKLREKFENAVRNKTSVKDSEQVQQMQKLQEIQSKLLTQEHAEKVLTDLQQRHQENLDARMSQMQENLSSTIRQSVEEANQEANQKLDALQRDLDNRQQKAGEMMRLASRLQAEVAAAESRLAALRDTSSAELHEFTEQNAAKQGLFGEKHANLRDTLAQLQEAADTQTRRIEEMEAQFKSEYEELKGQWESSKTMLSEAQTQLKSREIAHHRNDEAHRELKAQDVACKEERRFLQERLDTFDGSDKEGNLMGMKQELVDKLTEITERAVRAETARDSLMQSLANEKENIHERQKLLEDRSVAQRSADAEELKNRQDQLVESRRENRAKEERMMATLTAVQQTTQAGYQEQQRAVEQMKTLEIDKRGAAKQAAAAEAEVQALQQQVQVATKEFEESVAKHNEVGDLLLSAKAKLDAAVDQANLDDQRVQQAKDKVSSMKDTVEAQQRLIEEKATVAHEHALKNVERLEQEVQSLQSKADEAKASSGERRLELLQRVAKLKVDLASAHDTGRKRVDDAKQATKSHADKLEDVQSRLNAAKERHAALEAEGGAVASRVESTLRTGEEQLEALRVQIRVKEGELMDFNQKVEGCEAEKDMLEESWREYMETEQSRLRNQLDQEMENGDVLRARLVEVERERKEYHNLLQGMLNPEAEAR
mmetsp:Transcript_35105/g.80387  ORF Transcript_35105/g.80387 Transcript_35105/m.80387 type:complete len:814 (+) Transcript_35105:619-3060(+)